MASSDDEENVVLAEANRLRAKSEKPYRAPKWSPKHPNKLQVVIEDAAITSLKVISVRNKTTLAHVVELAIEQWLKSRKGEDTRLT